ncbi:Protein RER1 [Aphelenchoides besseyi]|nr:Protein RER1 [Aphelenchoides besseyi]KAI6223271.1 Protein RER1 [Aphelenchoides besseyi]
MDDDIRDQPSATSRFGSWLAIKYQHYLDRLTPYTGVRWGIAILTIFLFCWRIFAVQGFYIVTYALFIYYLNMFLAFLTPRIDPAFEMDSEDEEGPTLPRSNNEEFRPFMRRLPEFKFWLKTMKSTLIAFFMTFFEIFDIPVFWPILVMYFFVLTFLTMKRQIMHMIRYRYIPFTFGKPRPHGKEDSGKLVASDSTAHNSPLLIPTSSSA